jgi:hypothetical protein
MKKLLSVLVGAALSQTAMTQNVGIGTSSPHASAQLQVSSTTRGFIPPRMTQTQRLAIASPLNGLMVYDTDNERLFVHIDGNWQHLIDNRHWAGSSTRNWVYNGSDSVGIGTAAPTARLHVNGDMRVVNGDMRLANGDVVINKTGAIVQLQDGGADLGFIQLSGDNLRLGTNSGNATGNVVIRLNGTDRVFVDEFGRMGVGAASPAARLHVNGNISTTSDLVLADASDITRPATGSKDLLPLCYGRVRFMATSSTTTPNVTVGRVSQGVYEIVCPQFTGNTTIVVTMNEYQGGYYAYPNVENWPAGSNRYQITFYNISADGPRDAGFSFVAYQ